MERDARMWSPDEPVRNRLYFQTVISGSPEIDEAKNLLLGFSRTVLTNHRLQRERRWSPFRQWSSLPPPPAEP